jgi:hypothetical protein
MSIQMLALVPQIYAGRRVAAGSNFLVRGESDARLLTALGRASVAVPAPVAAVFAPLAPVQRWGKQIKAEETAPTDGAQVAEETPKPKRQYKRRDLTAEGTD